MPPRGFIRSRYPYEAWYKAVLAEVRERSGRICEYPGCKHKAEHFHHEVYPVGRRENANDLLHLCWWHHIEVIHNKAANDNFADLDQAEMPLSDMDPVEVANWNNWDDEDIVA